MTMTNTLAYNSVQLIVAEQVIH